LQELDAKKGVANASLQRLTDEEAPISPTTPATPVYYTPLRIARAPSLPSSALPPRLHHTSTVDGRAGLGSTTISSFACSGESVADECGRRPAARGAVKKQPACLT